MAQGSEFRELVVEFWHAERENRTIIVDDSHDADQFNRIIDHLSNTGWGINDVQICTDYTREGESVDITSDSVLKGVFDALCEDPNHAGTIIAYGELFGWHDAEVFEDSRHGRPYMEGYYGVYNSLEEFAEEFSENLEGEIPDWVSVDWTETAQTLMQDFQCEEFEGELYIFSN